MADIFDQYSHGRPDIEPIIYAYSDKNYPGILKVGDTARPIEVRMHEHYPTLLPTETPPYKVEMVMPALYADGTRFRDYTVHRMLEKRGIPKVNGEWFRCSVQDVRAAVMAVYIDSVDLDVKRTNSFGMRPEQKDAVAKTKAYYESEIKRNPNLTPKYLWNCKMRFGKTFTSYQLAKAMGLKKILILTFKPAVESAWEEDLETHIDFKGWQYYSREVAAKEGITPEKLDPSRPIVCFGSFQDFLGTDPSGGIKPKNEWVHSMNWDLVIFDEYHFGAWRENAKKLFESENEDAYDSLDIEKYKKEEADNAYNESFLPITTRFYLYLSGTPFRSLNSGEFIENQIYNWTYGDEQKAKRDWKEPPENPYAALPQMVLMTYKLPDAIRRIAMNTQFNEFDLNLFFSAESKTGKDEDAQFVYKDYVQKWLDLIRGAYMPTSVDELKQARGERPVMPYADVRLRRILLHTLWFLPGVKSCFAMYNLLKEPQNAFYNQEYTVNVCAGTKAGIGLEALPPVRKSMKNPLQTKTITLSCGKLTTGVTVKPWAGIFMLRNLSSPETYFQAAFRVQSPWEVEQDDGSRVIMKPECYVFDFALDRALRQISDYGCRLNVKESNPEKKIGEFINFLPVLAYDGSSMKPVDAKEILDITMSGTSATLLARRWESALLVNVDNDTLKRLADNPDAMAALMNIEGFTRSGSLDEQSNVASNPNNNNNINTNHDLKFLGYGGSNVASNNNWFWINNYTNENPSQGIVKDALGDDGYPQLGPGKNGQERGNPSLKYLFDPTSKNHNVYAFPNADGLFQQDNQGYYYYNSNSNYAEYDRNTNRFVLYEHTYSQNTGGSNGANAKPIGFFPFHEYDTVDTQPEMNFNKNLNHHFGMSMDVTFEIPPGNKQATGPDGNKHDIIYEFSGDDDLWVFVDDQLVLDIGGIHQPVTGTINFTTGEIKVHGVADKTMTFDVGGHTLKMFYIERGGCDSNLSVRFNLPLIVGKGDVRVVKKSMGTDETNEDTALPFAVFGIWDNPECSGDPYTVATSDLEGIINKNLPIRQVPQMYYMREMIPPAGYTLDRTIFTLTADGDKDADGDYVFTVSSNGTQLSETDNVLGCPIIWNQAVVPIKLKVKKQWQNADGTELTPDPTQATFAVKRTRTYSSVPMYTVMLRTDANNNQVFDTIIAHEGDVLTIAYTHTQDSNNYAQSCYAENGQFAVSLPTSKTIQQSTATYTVNHNHANQGTSNIVIVIPWESFAKYCNPEMNASCAFPHFENIQTAAYDMMTEVDTAFNSSDHKITVYSNGGWQAESEPFPAQETVSGVTYYYEYSIVEESVPDGYEVIYLDASGNPSTGSSSPSTSVGGEIGVINREFLDVPVEKQWGAFSSDRYTWEATFKLQKMEEKKNETDPDATDALVDWTDVKNTDEENVTLTIIKGQTPTPKFENLPVYVTHSNGTVYRQLYRAEETAYKVCRVSDNKVVAQWSEDSTVQVIGDKRYVPKFAQYAGEPGPINSDYEIKLLNVMEEQTQDKEIGLSIEKTWPEATGLADDSNASATFELKRKVHTETRQYIDTDVDTQWVDITLDTRKDGTKLQTLTVPVGKTMHILGSVKPGKDATITFSQSQEGGQPIVEIVQNTTGSDQMPFDITFTADQVKAVTLEAGEDFVVGGVDGFRLSDYTERTDDVVDSTYSNTFTLNANSWSKVIQDLPQVVEGPINPDTGVQIITVYSYYLVETDCNPKDFDPQYEIGGVVVADVANNAVTTTSTLTVNNVQKTTDVTLLKVDASKVNLESITDEDLLKGAAFTILKYPSKDAQGMDTSWGDNGTMTLRDEEQQDGTYTLNGRFNFEGLTTGYYVIDEIAFPDGYVRVTEKPTFTVDVDASGELVVNLENDAGGLVRMIDGELTFVIGNPPGFALPATGGPGTRLFTILGSIMILGAGVLLWRRRRLI